MIATDPAIHPKLNALFASPFGGKLDSLLGSVGMTPQFANGGSGGEIVLSVLGVIIVLVAGTIWRRRAMQNTEQSAKAA